MLFIINMYINIVFHNEICAYTGDIYAFTYKI